MRTIEEIAQSVQMDTERFKSMLEVFNEQPAFFGGDLRIAFLEANEIEEVKMIPLTFEAIEENMSLINDVLDGHGIQLVDRQDRKSIRHLCNQHLHICEEAIAEYSELYGSLDLNGYYFPSTDELIEFLRHNISIEA
tara:strand:+ start:217 stop:627 length:411 start_codon:yes stop_codon:yes gene_type:complete